MMLFAERSYVFANPCAPVLFQTTYNELVTDG